MEKRMKRIFLLAMIFAVMSSFSCTNMFQSMVLKNRTISYSPSKNGYTIHFEPNGGTGKMSPQNFLQGETITLAKSTFTYSGRTFLGWTDDKAKKNPTFADEAQYTKAANTTLYALWYVENFTQNDYDDSAFTEFDIYTPKQLESIAELSKDTSNTFKDKTITLQGDIVFAVSSFPGISSGGVLTELVIPTFAGTFDGNGYVIKNMHIKSDKTNIGFIGKAAPGSVIKNLGIDASCTIEGSSNVGGIAGSSEGTTIINCYNAAAITGKGAIGGIVGMAYNNTVIEKTYNIGKVAPIGTSSNPGAIAGAVLNTTSLTLTDVYYLDSTTPAVGTTTTITANKLSVDAFAKQSSFQNWDFSYTWKMGTTGEINGVNERPLLIEKKLP